MPVVFLLRPPNLVRRGPFFERKKWRPHKVRRDSKSPRRTKNTTPHSIFSMAGSNSNV